jgi:FtsH-binding integral membrane protein
MRRALRRYLNAALIGFIVTFVVYLFVRFNADQVVLGIVISLIGAAVALVVYVYADKKLSGGEPELYDKEGNLIDSKGKILKAKSQL